MHFRTPCTDTTYEQAEWSMGSFYNPVPCLPSGAGGWEDELVVRLGSVMVDSSAAAGTEPVSLHPRVKRTISWVWGLNIECVWGVWVCLQCPFLCVSLFCVCVYSQVCKVETDWFSLRAAVSVLFPSWCTWLSEVSDLVVPAFKVTISK